jgi:hypothetical protein
MSALQGLTRQLSTSIPLILLVLGYPGLAAGQQGAASPATKAPDPFEMTVGKVIEDLTNGVVKNPRTVPLGTQLEAVRSAFERLDTGRASRQLDAQSVVSSLANLVDQPSATNLISLAKGTGLFTSTTKDKDTTYTANFYSLFVLFNGPATTMEEYGNQRNWRHFTVSYTDGQKEVKAGQQTPSAKLTSWNGKWQFGTRDARDFYVSDGFTKLTDIYAQITAGLTLELQQRGIKPPQATADQIKQVLSEEPFRTLLSQLSAVFADEAAKLTDAVQLAAGKPTGSVSLSYTKVQGQDEKYQLQGTVLLPLPASWTLTGNASADQTKKEPGPSKKTYGGTGSVELARVFKKDQVKIQFFPKDGAKLSFSASATGEQAQKPQLMAQAKLEFLLQAGTKVPLSVTWANRSDLIKEKFVRGYVGLSFDAESLLNVVPK